MKKTMVLNDYPDELKLLLNGNEVQGWKWKYDLGPTGFGFFLKFWLWLYQNNCKCTLTDLQYIY